MAWDKINGPIVRTSLILNASSGAPSASGQVSIWNLSGQVQFNTPGGTNVPFGNSILPVPVVLASCISGAVIARISPDYACRAISVDYQGTQAPGNSGSATFQLGIQGTQTSGGLVTVLAGTATVGARLAGTAVTGANAVGTSGEITVTVATALSGAFTGGAGALFIKLGPPA